MTEALRPQQLIGPTHQGGVAGIVTRTLSAVIDLLVLVVAALLCYGMWAVATFFVDPHGFHFPNSTFSLNLSTATILAIIYFTVGWSLTGRTYGDYVMGLRVVCRDDIHPGVAIAFLRALLSLVFPIGLVWIIFSREHRSIQDLLLGTRVIYDWHIE